MSLNPQDRCFVAYILLCNHKMAFASLRPARLIQRGCIRLLPGDACDLSSTLANGQAFGWQQLAAGSQKWRGVLASMIITVSLPLQHAGGATSSSSSGSSSTVLAAEPAFDFEVHGADIGEGDLLTPVATVDSAGGATAGADLTSTSAASAAEARSVRGGDPASASCGSEAPTALSAGSSLSSTAIASGSAASDTISSFFHAHISMQPLIQAWCAADVRLAAIAAALPGMRILRQDPWECLISFVCSSNNNVPRITQMLTKLRQRYGEPIGSLDGSDYFAFPTPEALAAASEEDLRSLGVGYRAKFIKATAAKVVELGGRPWLLGLRDGRGHAAVHAALLQFAGVGPKVADCVAVFSCDVHGAIPVDTHVWAIACRDYDRSLIEAKSLTPRIYERVGDLFRARFGSHAGWAHSLLFAAELPAFRSRLPPAMRAEMEAFRDEEAGRKAEKRAAAAARKASKAASASAAAGGAGAGAAAEEGSADDDEEASASASASASVSASFAASLELSACGIKAEGVDASHIQPEGDALAVASPARHGAGSLAAAAALSSPLPSSSAGISSVSNTAASATRMSSSRRPKPTPKRAAKAAAAAAGASAAAAAAAATGVPPSADSSAAAGSDSDAAGAEGVPGLTEAAAQAAAPAAKRARCK